MSQPIRVAYVIWSLGLGGAEQAVIRLAAALDRSRFEPLIICLNEPGPFSPQAERAGVRVLAMHKRPGIDWALPARLARVLRTERVGIVHGHLWGGNLWGRLAGVLARVPVRLAHEHGMQPWRGRAHFLADRLLYGLTDRIIFVSEQVRETYCAKAGVKGGRCVVIPNGIESAPLPETRAQARAALGWAAPEQVILSIGRLSPEKGYADLLEALAVLRPRMPQVRLVVVGDGAEREALQALGERLNLNGQITFAGQQLDVRRWLAGADVYVQPSHREGLPLAVLEAMAAGVPVVATRVGDLGRIFEDGKHAHLVEPGQPGALAEALVRVLDALPAQRALTDAARKLIERHYTMDRMVRAIEDLYTEQWRYSGAAA